MEREGLGMTLMRMMDVHADIAEKLAVHRDLVVGLEFGRALEALGEFERALRDHMEAEERHILPLYEARVAPAPLGGDPEFFRLEHRNLLKNLAEIAARLTKLAADPKAGRRQAHEFLDAEHLFIHLLEHHDLRERNVLYPELDKRLSEREREELLARVTRPA